MARTVMSDKEFRSLMIRIGCPGQAQFILNWMSYVPDESTGATGYEIFTFKDLGYKDYRIRFFRFFHDEFSITGADVQIWRRSRIFGGRELRKLYLEILGMWHERYRILLEKGVIKIESGAKFIKYGNELEVTLEQKSPGDTPDGWSDVRNDFIFIQFRRRYD